MFFLRRAVSRERLFVRCILVFVSSEVLEIFFENPVAVQKRIIENFFRKEQNRILVGFPRNCTNYCKRSDSLREVFAELVYFGSLGDK
jgi:hypothetical protein